VPSGGMPQSPSGGGCNTCLGSGNEHRREVQRALALLGHYKGETDGGFGAGTRAAIKQFQTFEGDPETGTLTEPEHQALLQRAQRVAALLDQPATSPEGVSGDTVKGGAPRYAKAWAAEIVSSTLPPFMSPVPSSGISRASSESFAVSSSATPRLNSRIARQAITASVCASPPSTRTT